MTVHTQTLARDQNARIKQLDGHSDSALVAELRPTQSTVGFREVARKRRRLHSEPVAGGSTSFRRRSVPVVRGPGGRLFLLDNHHFARALYDEGVAAVPVAIVADMSPLTTGDFWQVCEDRGWCHPYDAAGRRHETSLLPGEVGELTDDPFRSLASAVRRAGGFVKSAAPYSEFGWADFLRRQIPRAALDADFDQAVGTALALAISPAAAHLPGWLGPGDRRVTYSAGRRGAAPFPGVY